MIKLSLITFTLLLSTNLYAKKCKIIAHEKILLADRQDSSVKNKFLKKSECNKKINDVIKNALLDIDGSIHASDLAPHLKNVDLFPRHIKVHDLATLLKEKLTPSKHHWFWEDIQILNQSHVILLKKDDNVSFNCLDCKGTGNKNIEIKIYNPLTSKLKVIWANATLKIRTKVLTPSSSISVSGQSLVPDNFKYKYINVVRPERYFRETKKLVFYKLNQALVEGTPLKNAHVTPINLVKRGKPAQVVYSNDNIKLIGKALPVRPGKYGDRIQLKNINSKKTIIGRVIDYNKVLVDL